VITGTVVESGSTSARFRAERRELFRDVYDRKGRADSNEALDEVTRYREIWRGVVRGLEQMGNEYRYVVGCQLPAMSAVRQSIAQGIVATKRGSDTTMLLESRLEEQTVRVVVYADNMYSSRIFDITDTNEYRAAIRERAANARLKREARFFNALLD
jgi:hypothetical protein